MSRKSRRRRKRFKRFHEPGDLHELTFSCYQRWPLLTNDDWRRKLSSHVDAAAVEFQCQVVAFVYMPEHVHMIIDPILATPNLDGFLARIKQPFSAEIHMLLEANRSPLLRKLLVRERPGKSCFRFSQEGPGYDRNLCTSKAILASMDYVHNNPVKRGLCSRAIDWKWSSARWYLGQPARQQDSDLPFIHGLRAGTLDVEIV